MSTTGPIGVFDSGYGGLTILREIRALLPNYDYLYLGDNARAPYGQRSFSLVLDFTAQAVKRLFDMGCQLVILACNTASAKALRSIQQHYLPQWEGENTDLDEDNVNVVERLPERRVLGVIRPTAECVDRLTLSGHVGIVATEGTIASQTYNVEIAKLHPTLTVTGQACPMWCPLVENAEYDTEGAAYFVQRDLARLVERDPLIDTIILGCTHYPLLLDQIMRHKPESVRHIVPQCTYVAQSLVDYLARHPEIDARLTRHSSCHFLTTEDAARFAACATIFMGHELQAERITL